MGSEASDDVDDVSPPWGSLPVEKFYWYLRLDHDFVIGEEHSKSSADLPSPTAERETWILGRRRRATKAAGERVCKSRFPTSGKLN